MTFFPHTENPPPEPERDPPKPTPPWRMEPGNELPSGAPIDLVVGRGPDVVVGLYGVRVYSTGMALRIGMWWRSAEVKNELVAEFLGIPPERRAKRQGIRSTMRWGLEYDGRKVTNADPYPYPDGHEAGFDAQMHAREERLGPPDRPLLTAGHGGSRHGFAYQNYWLWPLPSPGTLRVACEWTSRGIDETVTEIDATPIIEAARRVQPIWP